MRRRFARLRASLADITALEYGLIGGLIAVAITAGVRLMTSGAAANMGAVAKSLQ